MAVKGVFVLYVFHPPPLHQVDICHCVHHISVMLARESKILLLALFYHRKFYV